MGSGNMNLPPGFYFSPTDEELVLHFLYSKASLPCHPNIIPDLDLSLLDPWEFNGKALSSGNQHYFFTEKKGNRSTENGYWKEIGVTNSIFSSDADNKVGIKKYLVFNLGKAPQGTETNWVMEEYHICSSGFNTASCGSTRRRRNSDQSWSKWVLCRVYEKRSQSQQGAKWYSDEDDSGTEVSWLDEVFMSLDDDLEEISLPN